MAGRFAMRHDHRSKFASVIYLLNSTVLGDCSPSAFFKNLKKTDSQTKFFRILKKNPSHSEDFTDSDKHRQDVITFEQCATVISCLRFLKEEAGRQIQRDCDI